MKTSLNYTLIIILLCLHISCSKIEFESTSNVTDQSILNDNSKLINTNLKVIPTNIPLIDFISPSRDIPDYYSPIYSGTILPSNCCNGICGVPNNTTTTISTTNNTATFNSCVPVFDPFGNEVKYIGSYGPDDRQKYYVYRPIRTNINSPIVVLIHGGAWFSGPNPLTTSGYPFKFAQQSDINNNLVKSLLDSNFVVVSLLYRLVPYGDNDAEITTGGITIQNQIEDIEASIQHIRNNFPSCLGFNANSIQVVGESAGGHLALCWAYNYGYTSYVKSVISMYAPTNMSQFADSLKNKKRIHACNNDFYNYNPWGTYPNRASHYPYYFYIGNQVDPNQTLASISPLNCGINIVYSDSTNINQYLPNGGANDVRIDAYKMIQSLFHQTIINTSLQNISPVLLANTIHNIPTFIMHGDKDALVRYEYSTSGMKMKLSTLGGIDSLPNTSSNFNFASGNKHVLKIYTNANHTFGSIYGEATIQQQTLFNRVRKDIVDWLYKKK